MKYMLLIYGDPARSTEPGSAEAQDDHAAWMRVSAEMAPVTESGAALQPSTTATTVRANGEGTVLTDGPFAETKEVLGGFYVIDVPDLDTAVQWAGRLPIMGRGSVEVRPVAEMEPV